MIVEHEVRHHHLLRGRTLDTLFSVRVEDKAPLGSDLSAIADLEAGGGRFMPFPSFTSGFEPNAINPGVGA